MYMIVMDDYPLGHERADIATKGFICKKYDDTIYMKMISLFPSSKMLLEKIS